MRNYFEKIINILFPKKEINKKLIFGLIKNRNFLDKKNDIFSLLPYGNKSIRKSIKELKFYNNISHAKFFGEILFENISEYLINLEIQENFYNPILITIPLSYFRKLKRGYNQNDLIIKSFMKSGGDSFVQWEKNNLKKIKHTKPQSLMKNRAERLKNQKNVFKLKNPEKIKNQNIILFDDVYTTGATINEARKVLKKAGVKNIKVIVLTH